MLSIDIPPDAPPWHHAVVAEADPVLRGALAAALRHRRFTVAATADPLAALVLMAEADTTLAFFHRRGGAGTEGGERAVALATVLFPRARILLTAPCADEAEADAAPADGDPFATLPLTADPVRLAARLERWLAADPRPTDEARPVRSPA